MDLRIHYIAVLICSLGLVGAGLLVSHIVCWRRRSRDGDGGHAEA